MEKKIRTKKKIILIFLGFSLMAGSLLLEAIRFFIPKNIPVAADDAKQETDIFFATAKESSDFCPNNGQIQKIDDDDILFIGCNDFF